MHLLVDRLPPVLSNIPAARAQYRMALFVVLASVGVFVASAPFARTPMARASAFLPLHAAALFVCQLITAALLFGQFVISRSRGLLVLGGGYLFTAAMVLVYALTYPGIFSPGGLFGATGHTSGWLFIFWHTGFSISVIAYAALPGAATATWRPFAAAFAIVAFVALTAGALTGLAVAADGLLPPLLNGDRFEHNGIAPLNWALGLAALLMLSRRKPCSVLDLWLIVAMCSWLFELALSTLLNAGRFDAGFYVGRIYGLVAASVVLVTLLMENGKVHARLAALHRRERQKAADLEKLAERLNAANRLLDDLNRQLQQTSQMKSQFLAHMSHELRTPLNAVIGFSEVLKEGMAGPLGKEQHKYVAQIFNGGLYLLDLINDVLDLCKVEEGKMTLDLEPVALNEFVDACLGLFEEATHRRGIRVEFRPLHGDDRVVADARKVRQIVYNLVSNALKYTPDGGLVRVRLRAVHRDGVRLDPAADTATRMLPLPDGEHDEFVEISVADNGAGILGGDLPRLFQSFEQLDSPADRRRSGTGLGLTLVSRFAELHDGTAGVASAPGRGSRFSVWIPRRRAVLVESAAPAIAAAIGPAAAPRGRPQA
jgi:signal transduction histidine kinase